MSFLFHGGRICTMNPAAPWAEAVVVRGSRIAYVGPESGAREHTDAATEVVDLQGGMLLPGFIDAHDHLAMGALTKLGVNLLGLRGRHQVLDEIRAWVQSQPADAPLRGHGWYPIAFEGGSPRREWLDEITGDRPMLIFSGDAHDAWFNTAAMRVAGLDDSTPDPDPGSQYYVRDPDGTPTGHAVEGAATIPLAMALGVMSLESVRASQDLTLEAAPAWGITAYLEAGILIGASDAAEPVYADLVARDLAGTLPLRVVGTVWTREATDDAAQKVAVLRDWNQRLRSQHVQVSVLKMWADGGLFARGALMLEPYADQPDTVGRMTFDRASIEAMVAAVQEAGFDMHIHNDGDGSARVVLDSIESVQARLGRGSARHAMAHNTLVHPDDVQRFAELGVIANVTPLWGTEYDGTFTDTYTHLLGAERVEQRLFPYGDLVRSGAVVTYGADIPGVDVHEIPPLVQIQAAVTRVHPLRPDDPALIPRQAVDVMDALRAYTSNAAYQLRLEHEVGTIEAGKAADLVMLGADLTCIDPREIHSTPVRLTLMDGRVTHSAL